MSHQITSVANGGNVVCPSGLTDLVLNPTDPSPANITVTLPPNPSDGDKLFMSTTVAVNNFYLSSSDGTIIRKPFGANYVINPANQPHVVIFDAASNTWYPGA